MSAPSSSEVRSIIHARLASSGEKERLREHLRARLAECGWRDQVRLEARKVVAEASIDKLKLDELVAEITPKARASVPDAVKRELLAKIKDFIAKQNCI